MTNTKSDFMKKVAYNVDQRAYTSPSEKETARKNIGIDGSKFWSWDVAGNVELGTWNDSVWTEVSGVHNNINLIPNMTDSSGNHVHTNFDPNDPDAFKRNNDSAWIMLKKGIWHYDMEVEVECTTAGTHRTDLTLYAHEQKSWNGDYVTVRMFYTSFNPLEIKYTRKLSGTILVPEDPRMMQGYLEGYTLKFMVGWDTDIPDSVFRLRQQSLQLTKLGV